MITRTLMYASLTCAVIGAFFPGLIRVEEEFRWPVVFATVTYFLLLTTVLADTRKYVSECCALAALESAEPEGMRMLAIMNRLPRLQLVFWKTQPSWGEVSLMLDSLLKRGLVISEEMRPGPWDHSARRKAGIRLWRISPQGTEWLAWRRKNTWFN